MGLRLLLPQLPQPGMQCAVTEDGRQLSQLFDTCAVFHQDSAKNTQPQTHAVELDLACQGQGWVRVELRGSAYCSGPHGQALILAWVNGQRLLALGNLPETPLYAALAVPVQDRLRLSLLLLAQRDPAEPAAAAGCWLDSIDLAVLDPITQQRPREGR